MWAALPQKHRKSVAMCVGDVLYAHRHCKRDNGLLADIDLGGIYKDWSFTSPFFFWQK